MPHPVVHFEIGCRDSVRSEEFYSKLFDWQITRSGPAAMINTATKGAIDGHITSLGHEPHNYVTFYVEVENLNAHLERAQALGGKTLVSPVELPLGSLAWFADRRQHHRLVETEALNIRGTDEKKFRPARSDPRRIELRRCEPINDDR